MNLGGMNRVRVSLRLRVALGFTGLLACALVLLNLLSNAALRTFTVRDRQNALLEDVQVLAGLSERYILKKHEYLKYMAEDLGRQVGARLLILDATGRVVVDSFDEEALLDQPIQNDDVQEALAGKPRTSFWKEAGSGWVIQAAAPIGPKPHSTGVVVGVRTLPEAQNLLQELATGLGIVSLMTLGFAAAGGAWFAGRLTGPIARLDAAARKMAKGQLEARVPDAGQDELGRLGAAFNEMAGRLEQYDRVRRQFASDAAHELRTPISSIKVMLEPLLREPPESPDLYIEFLGDIRREVERLERLAEDLLELDQLESGTYILRPRLLSLSEWLPDVLERFRPRAESLAIDLRCTLMTSSDVTCYADPVKLDRALSNLIANALAHTPAGGYVRVGVEGDHTSCTFSVADSGHGIPKEELPYIFQRFYRTDRARDRSVGGSGLGLAIVAQIVNLHGGRIDVESEVGVGTTFRIWLPNGVINS